MAVYQGARQRPAFGFPALLRPGVAPRPRLAPPASTRAAHGRRDARARVGIRRSTSPRVGLILAAIIVLFSGSFLWLSQSVRVAATNYDIVRLISERDRLEALSVDLRSDLDRLSGEPAVRQEALDRGFGQLGVPIVVPAR